jgi:hypothetical protein
VAFYFGELLVKSKISREDIVQAMQECAAELRRRPGLNELTKMRGISRDLVYARFANYKAALEACGMDSSGGGLAIEMKQLFKDWAGVARKVGRTPTMTEFVAHGRYSAQPLLKRFDAWSRIPAGMEEFARKEGLTGEWSDVMEMIEKRKKEGRRPEPPRQKKCLREEQPVFGRPLGLVPMVYAPTCEQGVLFLFGALAERLGFAIEHVQQAFPDCIAMREVTAGRCQRVRIELEQESRNFLAHAHAVDGCDLIVCWIHNWPDCPLEVIELKSVLEEMRRKSGDLAIG